MITKEQAMNCTSFRQIAEFKTERRMGYGAAIYLIAIDTDNPIPLVKPMNWKANGRCHTWKHPNRARQFKLPIKSGLYSYSYITEENAHLFEVVS